MPVRNSWRLKNLCQIAHTRHRSPANFVVNLLAGRVAYCLIPSKPKIPVVGTYPRVSHRHIKF
ncbi:hypothetical protein [Candidatus Arsenophonus triatominarum]|uniref:hypothetical protein n=1 Tax=Candidatus Arsenophonus triatominarum TaxID=57911 RepID=UPI000B24F8D1|nr:hypothetical protein [Candidatus Arsenophonus triatominarum]